MCWFWQKNISESFHIIWSADEKEYGMIIVDTKKQIEILQQESASFYLMGAGYVAGKLLETWSAQMKQQISAILVTKIGVNPSELYGIPVNGICNCQFDQQDIVLMAVYPKLWDEMVPVLEKAGVRKIVGLSNTFFMNLQRETKEGCRAYHPHEKLRFEVQVAEHCNLNCAACYHYAPLAEPEFLDLDQYQRDIDRLSQLSSGKVEWIHLMGGEPLLNPQLIDIMQMTRRAFPLGSIQIVTNGIALPHMAECFWQCCHEDDIEVCPTRYPIHVDYEGMKQKAERYGVKYHLYNEEQKVKTMDWSPLCPVGGNSKWNFEHCEGANECITLRDGKLYTCVFPAHVHHLVKYFELSEIEVVEQDGVDIYKIDSLQELMEKLAEPIPFCKYCRIDKRKYGVPFSISKKKAGEWIVLDEKRV